VTELTFSEYVEKEKHDIYKRRAEVIRKRNELDQDLAELDKEMAAINAYETIKSGKVNAQKGSGTRGKSRRIEIIDIIKSAGDGGVTSAEIIKKLGVERDKEQSVRTTLSTMKNKGTIKQDEATKKYLSA
jgi:hypothetical protein